MQNKLFFGDLNPGYGISEAYVAASCVREKSMKWITLELNWLRIRRQHRFKRPNRTQKLMKTKNLGIEHQDRAYPGLKTSAWEI